MTRHFRSMTPEALSRRADRIEALDCVADHLGGTDTRGVSVYYEHHGMRWTSDGVFPGPDSYAEVIGVVLGGEDTPTIEWETLDREGARDRFGDAWVTEREEIESERLWA